MSKFLKTVLDKLDLTAGTLLKPAVGLAIALIVAIIVIVRRRRRRHAVEAEKAGALASSSSSATAPRSPTHSRAVYMARESAKLIAQALEAGSGDVVRAYAGAVQASVLAQTAKELVDDMSVLSRDLGVDMYEYLAYTSNVLRDAQDRLVASVRRK